MSIVCNNFKKFDNGFLQGFADLYIEKWGVDISGFSLYCKNGSRWINIPSKEFQNDQGEKKWMPIIKFSEKSHQEAFLNAAIDAIDKFCSENSDEPSQSSNGVF